MTERKQGKSDTESTDSDDEIPYAVIGTAAGAVFGGPAGGAAGAAVGLLADYLTGESDGETATDEPTPHDRALLTAARQTQEVAADRGGQSASVYYAHVADEQLAGADEAEKGTGTAVEKIDGRPDIVYHDVGGPTGSALVEVETLRRMRDDPGHVEDQLNRYRLTGYQTVLVVPEADVSGASEFVQERDEIEDERTYVVGAESLGSFL